MKDIKVIKIGDKGYPESLLELKDPPKQLYVLGDETLLNKKSIAIIGSRDCTEYGYRQAIRFAKELSQNNICVVSGMAIGIDSAAHIGAKDEQGKTIAVLGSGFNHIFPEENKELFKNILERGGCIISEYGPDIEYKSDYFPERNRIVSALSSGLLVVEARHRSGTSITAKHAKKLGKNIYCIPTNLEETTGVGTGRLIQNGAKLVLKPEDILVDLGFNIEEEELNDIEIEVEEQYKPVYEVLTKIPMNVNDIVKKSRKSMIEVNSALTMLELQDLVKQTGIGEFIKTK